MSLIGIVAQPNLAQTWLTAQHFNLRDEKPSEIAGPTSPPFSSFTRRSPFYLRRTPRVQLSTAADLLRVEPGRQVEH